MEPPGTNQTRSQRRPAAERLLRSLLILLAVCFILTPWVYTFLALSQWGWPGITAGAMLFGAQALLVRFSPRWALRVYSLPVAVGLWHACQLHGWHVCLYSLGWIILLIAAWTQPAQMGEQSRVG